MNYGKKKWTVIPTVIYLLIILSAEIWFGIKILNAEIILPENSSTLIESILIGGLGGILYCLRSIYLNYSVKNSWSEQWLIWYFLRPITSLMCGGVSYLFLKAGLLVLDAKKESDASNLGFFAIALIAGLNVDKFIKKIEDLAKSTWGIDQSRASKPDGSETPNTTNSED